MTKDYLMNLYKCDIFQDIGFDDKRKYWVALGSKESGFEYADGWTLKELKESIDKQIKL